MSLSTAEDEIPVIRLLLRIPVPWVFVLIYFAGAGFQIMLPMNFFTPEMSLISVISGLGLFAIAAAIAAWCLSIFRRAKTTTIPGESSARLVTWGPYRASRNPMYVSLILAYLGETAILRQIWPLMFLPLGIAYLHLIVIPIEEAKLQESFGAEYIDYCGRVRRWI